MAKNTLNLCLLIGAILNVAVLCAARNDGKYRSSKYNSGKYVPGNEGKYVPMRWPYMHIHDNRELGKYVHVHIPYDGGFGPYSGDIDKYRYNYDPAGDYSHSKYTTTTTTTPRPRVRYDDEGKWRIIRQEEKKNQKRYDYLYLTENGIYAEEQAKLTNANSIADGTHGKGYYHYTGDDGKLYQVVYTVGEQGFVPMAEHIPTPPPIPDAIQKALDFVATKETLDNGKYDPKKYEPKKKDTKFKNRITLPLQPWKH